MTGAPPVLVLCLGNDFRRDDGVGWRVADLLEADPPMGAVLRKSPAAGLYLLDELVGFDRAVIVDAIRTGTRPAGSVLRLGPEALQGPAGTTPHGAGLPTVLDAGRRAGLLIPLRIEIVAVEVEEMHTLRVGLTASVEEALPTAVLDVRAAVRDLQHPPEIA